MSLVVCKESVTVAKDQWVWCEAWEVIFANVNGVVVIGDRIIDCLGPWSTIELELKPFVVATAARKLSVTLTEILKLTREC